MSERTDLKYDIVLLFISSALAIIGFFMYGLIQKVDSIHERQITGMQALVKIHNNTNRLDDHETRIRVLESNYIRKEFKQ